MNEYVVEYTEDMVYVVVAIQEHSSDGIDTFYEEVFSCSCEHPIEVSDKIAAFLEQFFGGSVEIIDATE